MYFLSLVEFAHPFLDKIYRIILPREIKVSKFHIINYFLNVSIQRVTLVNI